VLYVYLRDVVTNVLYHVTQDGQVVDAQAYYWHSVDVSGKTNSTTYMGNNADLYFEEDVSIMYIPWKENPRSPNPNKNRKTLASTAF